jgi:DNA-binding transcriptional regulator YiaG
MMATKIDIKNELNKIRKKITIRHMAYLLDVTEVTIRSWMAGDTEPKASQMDTLRAFVEKGN